MKRRFILLATLLLLFIAPLAGGLLHGLPEGFTRFPPLLHQDRHLPAFSWPVFIVFAALSIVGLMLLAARVVFRPVPPADQAQGRFAFPPWGYLGLALNLASWVCAWGRFEALGLAGSHTFFPLWLGYILVVDALVFLKEGMNVTVQSYEGRPLSVALPETVVCEVVQADPVVTGN